MTARRTLKDVPYAATEMYDLVASMDRYPDFLPWCTALRIVSRQQAEETEFVLVDMVVNYSVFREQFRSRAALNPSGLRIDTDYVHGPFRFLRNHWVFTERDADGSTVDFNIEFEFRNPMLQATAHSAFERVFLKMADAFIIRAEEVYGPRS